MKPKNEEVRNQIIAAATELIIESGIAGTSTVKVAKRINGAQSNIYSYFKSKEALIAGVFAYHQDLLTKAIAPVLDDTKDAKHQIRAVTMALLQFADSHPTSIQIIAAFRAQPSLRHSLPTIKDSSVFTTLFTLLTHFQSAGTVKPLPAEYLAEATFSLIVDYCTAKLAGESYISQLSTEKIVGLVEDLTLVHS